MKTKKLLLIVLIHVLFVFGIHSVQAQITGAFKEIKGKIIDESSKEALVFTDILISGSNISTITNSDGEFVLKVPDSLVTKSIIISNLGYQKKEMKILDLDDYTKITLKPAITELNVVEIKTFKDARALVHETLSKKSSMYNPNTALMTAFYRETIKKRRKNASLSEAVVHIHKQPYNNLKDDAIALIKARKSTNYTRLDTLALKLQGGPFGNLYTDIIKYPEYIFTDEDLPLYDFSFDASTQINANKVYVINFKQKPTIKEPLYFGKLYIDAETLALTNAVYSLNVENRVLASQMYVRKKPKKAEVYPTQATYRVNYRTQNGKWHFAYSNILLTFKVNWEGKLFNSIYSLNSEMAITDWLLMDPKLVQPKENILKPTTILADEASGFSDPAFWGEYNIIEPEKSIESAIDKIRKQLQRT